MKLYYATLCVIFIVGLMAACSKKLDYKEALVYNQRNLDEDKMKDARFLVEMYSLIALEIELTSTARTSGYASAVVALGKTHLTDHKKMMVDLKNVARKADIALPISMKEDDKTTYLKFKDIGRRDFDKAFISELEALNKKKVERFEQMATEAKDNDIRSFAAKKLGILRSHSKSINEVNSELLNTY